VADRAPRRPLTHRKRHGNDAESLAARDVTGLGWTVLGRQVRVDRDEVDLLCLDPGPPATLVVLEVRSHSSSRFGLPEESVDRRKVARLYRAAGSLRRAGVLDDGTPLPRLPWRVDLVSVDLAPNLSRDLGGPTIRHLRALRLD
jgi:putative endonuclease